MVNDSDIKFRVLLYRKLIKDNLKRFESLCSDFYNKLYEDKIILEIYPRLQIIMSFFNQFQKVLNDSLNSIDLEVFYDGQTILNFMEDLKNGKCNDYFE